MRPSKLSVLLSVLGVLILLVAACAPSATPTATPTPTPVVATPTPTPGVATPTPTPGVATPTATPPPVQPQYGGILNWDVGTSVHFDPQRSTSVVASNTPGMVFNSLVRFDPLVNLAYYDAQYIIGDLAERWETSTDGKLYTFYLRKGVKFHDGKPFTAKDVKYSLEKLRDPKRSAFALEFAVIDRVDIVDDYTVKVYLKFASLLFIKSLAQGFTIMEPEHLKDVSFRTPAFAIGTGAFKLRSQTPGIEAIFDKNPDYYIKGRPYFDGVIHRAFDNFTAAVSAFMGRRLDVGFGIGVGQTKDDVETVKKFAPDALFLWHTGYLVVRGTQFNFAKEGPWQDVRVRKAMALTTDFEGAQKAAYGGQMEMANPDGYFYSAPKGVGLPWSQYQKAWWLDRPLEERIAEAKRLLAQAGYPDGFKAEYLSRGTPTNPGVYGLPALLMQDLWKKRLNIVMEVQMPESAVEDERRTKGQFDIIMTFWVSTVGDPEQLLVSVFLPGGSTNFGKYSHPRVEELYQQIKVETNPQRRIDLIHQAERLLIDDIPLLPFYRSGKGLVMWAYVKDWKWHPYHTFLYNTQEIAWFDKNDPSWAKRGVTQ